MVAQQMRKMFAFNSWAWQRVFASVEQLNDQAYKEPRNLFDGSIHGTLVHCMSAEDIWYSRCKGSSPGSLFDPRDFADFKAVRAFWQTIWDNWADFLRSLSDDQCAGVVNYKNTRGDNFSLILVDVLQHVVNHATEHRSQVTPILYHLDVPTQPLDYMLFQLDMPNQ